MLYAGWFSAASVSTFICSTARVGPSMLVPRLWVTETRACGVRKADLPAKRPIPYREWITLAQGG
jgi:hypothetical protein